MKVNNKFYRKLTIDGENSRPSLRMIELRQTIDNR